MTCGTCASGSIPKRGSLRRYATHQAENAARARSEYLSGLSHQMRAPLHTLTMQIDLLEAQGGEVGYERAAEGGSVFWFRLPREVGHHD